MRNESQEDFPCIPLKAPAILIPFASFELLFTQIDRHFTQAANSMISHLNTCTTGRYKGIHHLCSAALRHTIVPRNAHALSSLMVTFVAISQTDVRSNTFRKMCTPAHFASNGLVCHWEITSSVKSVSATISHTNASLRAHTNLSINLGHFSLASWDI